MSNKRCSLLTVHSVDLLFITSFKQNIPIVSFPRVVSILGIIVVVFLRADCEHGLQAQPGTWVQVVLVGAVDQIIAEVWILVAWLIWLSAVVVHHWVMMAAAGLLGCPVVPMAAQYHHHGYSGQEQEGTASRQHIVPEGRLRHHWVYCGLHPRHGTPWRAGGHITGWLSGKCRNDADMQGALEKLLILCLLKSERSKHIYAQLVCSFSTC